MLKRLVELISPERLGRNFRWIWSSATISNLGDGIVLAAGPLLVASITTEPFAVAMAVFAQRIPWFLFGLQAGAIVDRVDRRRLIIVVDLLRGATMAALTAAVAFDFVSLPFIYITMFVLGTAETFSDNARSALLATAVPKAMLGQANARLFGTLIVTNQLAGPPIGALLFAGAMAAPFGIDAVSFVIGAVLVAGVRRETATPPADKTPIRTQVLEGLKWLASNPPVRTLVLLITVFNVTFGAAFGILVLYATERLGLSAVGFGMLLACLAVGGVIGSIAFGPLEKRTSYATLLRIGLIVETLTHLILALTRSYIVAGVVMVAFGVHAVLWGTTSTTVRQKTVPPALLGRVTSVHMIGCFGALALGSMLGGVIASRWGVVAPFWFAFAGSAVILVTVWGAVGHVTQQAEEDA
jgi:MFS family permease